MHFRIFTPLYNQINTITNTYITDISSKAIVTITPVVSIGLSIAFIVYGWLIIRGAVDMPLSGFVNRCLRISIITSMALTSGLYQSEIADLIMNTFNSLLSALTTTQSTIPQMTAALDMAATEGFNRASEAFEEAAFLDAGGLLYGLFGILILVATSSLTAISGTFILLTQIALVLLLGLGPIFIIALLWQPTYRFFEQWITQILSYAILLLFLTTISNLMMSIFVNYMKELKFDGNQNVSYALGGALILSIISIVLLLKISSIANALAKGITFGHLWKLNTSSRKQ